MNIHQLEHIIALDRFKNLSKAAEYCYVAEATLNTTIKKLEVQLGIVLFTRVQKHVYTTDAGAEIIVEAKKIVEQSEVLVATAKKIKSNLTAQAKVLADQTLV
ncbi:LysR family transcriptional regulator [Pedobacter quisquiliarum]|uniref:LysR family transcriptional regulator n=1 Tax=Pedobacter quisquiliarum TaxID=1834438 RepID=UPI0016650BE9|nr:LysR family transcriptional regulator [Pedobacter quisquiliarum]